MRLISEKRLREFWLESNNRDAESPLKAWNQTVKSSDWTCFAEIRKTYSTADQVGNKVVFNVGGNKYRLIVVIDYERQKIFVRYVLNHKDYDKGYWKDDPFGKDWKPQTGRPSVRPEPKNEKGQIAGREKASRRQNRPKKR